MSLKKHDTAFLGDLTPLDGARSSGTKCPMAAGRIHSFLGVVLGVSVSTADAKSQNLRGFSTTIGIPLWPRIIAHVVSRRLRTRTSLGCAGFSLPHVVSGWLTAFAGIFAGTNDVSPSPAPDASGRTRASARSPRSQTSSCAKPSPGRKPTNFPLVTRSPGRARPQSPQAGARNSPAAPGGGDLPARPRRDGACRLGLSLPVGSLVLCTHSWR